MLGHQGDAAVGRITKGWLNWGSHAVCSDSSWLRELRKGLIPNSSRFWIKHRESWVYKWGQHRLPVQRGALGAVQAGAVALCMHQFIFDLTA